MSRLSLQLCVVFSIFLVQFFNPDQSPAATDDLSDLQMEKLTAFAKTYGYARFFHPSDQASLLDWNQMAIFGANEILNSPDDESTQQVLSKIFGPVVVDLQFYEGQPKELPETKQVPANEVLAWQHFGVGLGGKNSMYRSARTNRSVTKPASVASIANVLQAMDANELRGKEIRFRFQAKVGQKPCRLQGWFRVDRESEEKGLFDNMGNRPITSNEWAEYELSGTVDDDAELITFGVMMMGKGSGLIDDAKLEVKNGDEWSEIEIRNANFEDGDSSPDGWIGTAKGYDYVSETKDVAQGDQAMRIAVQTKTSAASAGFLDVVPELGEVVDAEVSTGLRVRMPLAMPADARYVKGDDEQVDSFIKRVAEFSKNDHNVIATANIAITWSVFQHFYPYFDQVETDWERVLVSSMKTAAGAEDRKTATKSLQWLVAQLHDGHGTVMDPKRYQNMKFLPLSFGWVEDQLVVLASNDESIQVGDIVTQIDGKPSIDCVVEEEALISGSPQWKRYRSLAQLSVVFDGRENVTVKLKRGDKEWESELETGTDRPPVAKKREVVDVIEEGEEDGSGAIYYVDLGRAEPSDVDPMIEKFANAKGIVFDMRGYPRGTQYLFQHMTDEHMQSAQWLVSKQVRPDRVDMADFDKRGRWEMPPREPRFKGKFAFITNGSAISYAESCMAIVANYKLAEIIGSPTAGANGNINPFELPGGYRVIYTGMRVINHDDSQHHVLGVKPTIPMEPTVVGVREGKDELLDAAIKVVK
jgi:C-terminal processing protease CtpA/Prc